MLVNHINSMLEYDLAKFISFDLTNELLREQNINLIKLSVVKCFKILFYTQNLLNMFKTIHLYITVYNC